MQSSATGISRFIKVVVVFLMMSWAVTLFGLYEYYLKTCPRVADQESGHIYPLNNHGYVVYLTFREKWAMDFPWLFGAAAFVLGLPPRIKVGSRQS